MSDENLGSRSPAVLINAHSRLSSEPNQKMRSYTGQGLTHPIDTAAFQTLLFRHADYQSTHLLGCVDLLSFCDSVFEFEQGTETERVGRDERAPEWQAFFDRVSDGRKA